MYTHSTMDPCDSVDPPPPKKKIISFELARAQNDEEKKQAVPAASADRDQTQEECFHVRSLDGKRRGRCSGGAALNYATPGDRSPGGRLEHRFPECSELL